MNVQEELSKLQRISEQAALVIALHRESLDDPDFDVFAVIKQIKQEILELLAPLDIHVVYSKDCNGCANPIATAFLAKQADAIERVRFEQGEAEYDEQHGVEVYIETETLE